MPENVEASNTEAAPILADLHTHILPGMDDGAQTPEDSMALLRAEAADGVGMAALTPHFHPLMGLGTFLAQRAKAEIRLAEILKDRELNVELRPGAEVRMDPALLDTDLSRLCIQGTNVILLELPLSRFPHWGRDVIRQALLLGLTPLLVHVDRYPYLLRQPNTLVPLIEAGACTHVNAASLLAGGRLQRELLTMIRHGLVHAVASDTHSMDRRPPNLAAGLAVVAQHLGEATARQLNGQAAALFWGDSFERPAPRPVRRVPLFGGKTWPK